MSTSNNSSNNTITNISNVNMLSSVRYELNQLFNFKNDRILESFYDDSNLNEVNIYYYLKFSKLLKLIIILSVKKHHIRILISCL